MGKFEKVIVTGVTLLAFSIWGLFAYVSVAVTLIGAGLVDNGWAGMTTGYLAPLHWVVFIILFWMPTLGGGVGLCLHTHRLIKGKLV